MTKPQYTVVIRRICSEEIVRYDQALVYGCLLYGEYVAKKFSVMTKPWYKLLYAAYAAKN